MKTAEQIAAEYTAGLFNTLSRDRYLTNKDIGVVRRQIAAALKEYGEAVRQKAADTVRPRTKRPCDCETCDCGNSGDQRAVDYWDESNWAASAIERMELP